MKLKSIKKKLERVLKSLKSIFSPTKVEPVANPSSPKETKQIINEANYTAEQKEIFDRLQTGDLVYSWMPLSDEELEKIADGHRTRPYYVVSKNEDSVDACLCTSIPIKLNNEFSFYMLSNYSYENLTKESYLDLKHIHKLPIDCLIDYLGHVNDNDFNEINKRLYKGNNGAFVKRFGESDKYKTPNIGDIIRCGKTKMLVIADIGKYYRVLKIRSGEEDYSEGFYVKVGKSNWKILKKDGYRQFLKKKQSYKIYHTLNKGEFSKVQHYLDGRGGCNCIPKNYLIGIGDEKYYCSYGSYNGKTQAYRVYINEEREGCQIIRIDNISYSIDYKKQEVISDFSNVTFIQSINNYKIN